MPFYIPAPANFVDFCFGVLILAAALLLVAFALFTFRTFFEWFRVFGGEK